MEGKSQVELLHQISNIVSSNLSLEKMLQQLIGLAVDVTRCDACLVYLVDRHRKEIVLRASQLPHAREIGHIRMKMGEGITGWVAQNKSVVALGANAAGDTRFKSFQKLQEDTYEAFLSVPLVSSGELVGVINIHHIASHAHTQEEIGLVSFLGEQMGVAIARAALAERSERATRRMEALAGLAEQIGEKNYLDRILQTIAEMVADKMEAPVCSVMLVDEDRQELVISAARSSSEDYMHKLPVKVDDSAIGRAVREGVPVIISNILEEKQYRYPELTRKTGLASLLAVPMTTRDVVIGTVNIYTREIHEFTEEEIGFVKVVASQAAIAIDNARLMAETLEAKRALEIRKIVERAKGIMQAKYGLTEEAAYLRLRNESRRLRRPMRELAEAVILADELEKQRATAVNTEEA